MISAASVFPMIGDVLLRLGEFRFSVSTAAFEGLSRTSQYQWVGQSRLWNGQSQQFTGLGEDIIKLEGTVFPHEEGDIHALNILREMAAPKINVPGLEGMQLIFSNPYDLVTGYGEWLGLWVITEISEMQSHHFQDGAPRVQKFGIGLKYYGEDWAHE